MNRLHRRELGVGLVVGFVADRVLGDPRRGHPVAGFGTLAAALERRVHRDSVVTGAVHTTVLVGGAVLVGSLLPRRWWTGAAATWAVLGGTTLDREAAEVEALLADDDLAAARTQVARLVGRDTSVLDHAGVARAAVESVAENTSDAVVAPLVWGALLGVPGLLGYRAANTLDAMVGHRSERYLRFGRVSARLDDLLNLPASRLTATLVVLLGDDRRAAARAWRRDARHHPSPNAGPIEAAFAGALGIRLGGVNVYQGRAEDRHVLGDGREPDHHDLARARRLARRVDVAALIVLVPIAARRRRRRPR